MHAVAAPLEASPSCGEPPHSASSESQAEAPLNLIVGHALTVIEL